MKFWKTWKSGGGGGSGSGNGTLDRSAANTSTNKRSSRFLGSRNKDKNSRNPDSDVASYSSSCNRDSKRRSNTSDSTLSFYEEFVSPLEVGTTFVELIKRRGTYLGVTVSQNEEKPPKIQELIPGSWAQRSDVLCVGDVIVGVNGIQASAITRLRLAQILDEADRIQLEVNYKLPPQISTYSK